MSNVSKSTYLKLRVLEFLKWVPDEYMIKIQYYLKTGRVLDLNNPKRYTEKLQWYKLYYKDIKMKMCSDKYLVRDYISQKGLGSILNDLYFVYDSNKDIDIDQLPNEFILKSTNGASGLGIYICSNKNSITNEYIFDYTKEWMKTKIKTGGREWVYEDIRPRIVAEKILPSRHGESSVVDYKFFCFNGEPFCLYVMTDRFSAEGVKQSILNIEYEVLPYMREKIKPITNLPPKPENFDKMIEIAKKLSEDFPYVRVDLYNIEGRIIFGEMTFFPESGYYDFEPDNFDYILGEKFKLPKTRL